MGNRWLRSWHGRLLTTVLLVSCAASSAHVSDSAARSTDASAAASSAESRPVDSLDATSTAEPPENLLGWLHRSLGTRLTLIFLALTFVLVALMVVNVLAVRRDSIAPPGLISALELRLGDDRFIEAGELVRGDRSFLARVLTAGLTPLTAGDAKTAL